MAERREKFQTTSGIEFLRLTAIGLIGILLPVALIVTEAILADDEK